MKILALDATNFMKLSAVHIEPSGNLVPITGKNGNGKTSVLQAIWVCLAGASVAPKEAIRKGATKAVIELTLGDGKQKLIARRTFNRKEDGEETTSIVVESAEGARFPSPQKLLDQLLGKLTFDPLAFSRMSPKDKFDALKTFVPGVDFDALDALNRGDFDRRQDINREEKRERAAAQSIVVPEGTPLEPIDETDLVAQLEKAGEQNADIERRKSNRESAKQDVERRSAKAAELKAKGEELRRQANEIDAAAALLEHDVDQLRKKLETVEPLPLAIDTTKIREQITAAKSLNQAVDARAQRERHVKLADQLAQRSDELTASIAERNEQKAAAVRKATMPIDGLTFGESIVLLNNVPFEQASDAEQLRASVAIAMALNKTLKVVRIRDGSLLDEDGLRLIGEMAEARDCQVWIERVDSTGTMGFVLEDGHLKGQDTEPAKEVAA